MNRLGTSSRWGSRIAVLVVGSVVVLATSHASGTNPQVRDLGHHARAVGAEKWSAGGLVGVQVVSETDRHADQRAYDPAEGYPGFYDSQRVYQIVLGPRTWKANRRPEWVRDVTCREARTALEQQGVWIGRLTEDGSCMSGDETNWATGNFLNFQARPHDDSDL